MIFFYRMAKDLAPKCYFILFYIIPLKLSSSYYFLWCRGVVVIATAQLHSTKSELRFFAVSNPPRGLPDIRDGEGL